MNQEALFQERQFIRSNPLTFMIWPIVLFIWVISFLQLGMGIEIGNKPASNSIMVILLISVGIILPLIFLSLNLSVKLTKDQIQINYLPFAKRSIPINEIMRVEARRSNPVQEYGGWGLRFSPTYGWSYTIKGVDGIQLNLKSGQNIFIGSTSTPRLFDLINNLLSK